MFWFSPSLGFICTGSAFLGLLLFWHSADVLAFPGRFCLFWLPPGLDFICFGIPYEVSLLSALPGLRFHLLWLSLGLGLICFGFPYEVSPLMAFPWLRA